MALAALDDVDELGRLQQRGVGAGVEPGEPAPERLDLQGAVARGSCRLRSVISNSPRADGFSGLARSSALPS